MTMVEEHQLGPLTGADLAAEIQMITALESQLTVRKLAVIGEWDARQEWRADGHVTGSSWLVQHCSQSRASAGGLIRDARLMRQHPEVADAVGRIGATRARIVLSGAKGRTGEAFGRDQQKLIEAAATLTVDQTSVLMRHWARCADTDGQEPVDDTGEVNCSVAGETTVINGNLTGVDGRFVQEALNSVAEEIYRADQACDDGRSPCTPAQRRARALVEIFRRAMATDPETAAPAPPLVVLTVDLDTLEDRAGSSAHVDHDATITPDEARRVACDAHISRLIWGPRGEVLDLGRATRVPNAAQRRAIRARDNGCAVPGCPAPPGWCDVHHIRFWTRQHGPTDLNNLVMVCNAHHHMVHSDQLSIESDHGALTFRRADRTIINPRPDTP